MDTSYGQKDERIITIVNMMDIIFTSHFPQFKLKVILDEVVQADLEKHSASELILFLPPSSFPFPFPLPVSIPVPSFRHLKLHKAGGKTKTKVPPECNGEWTLSPKRH
jgi:hypothetical protein